MPKTINPTLLNHFNLVLPDFHDSLAHFRALYGADFLMELPGDGYHAGLFEIGRVIFEIFSPDHWLMNARYGPHYLGVEYQADLGDVREAIADRGIRIIRDLGPALHTHPADTFGVAFEFYGGSFHDNTYELLGNRKMRSRAFWRDEHPLGLEGLKRYSLAVADIGAATGFLSGFLGGSVIYREDRPAMGARAVGLEIAGSGVEVLTAVASGPLQRHHNRHGDGIRSVVFAVADLERVRRYFSERGVEPVPGESPDVLAIAPVDNRGLLFEFSEQ